MNVVSLELSMFLTSRYDVTVSRFRWLCPRCHTFESKEMKNHQAMKTTNDRSPNADESMEEDFDSDEDDQDNEDDQEDQDDQGDEDDQDDQGDEDDQDDQGDEDDQDDQDDIEKEAPCDDEQDEGSSFMNDGMETESKDDDDSQCMTDGETDPESMDEELGDVSYDLEYQQNEAMEKLSTIFRFLNIDPVHDK